MYLIKSPCRGCPEMKTLRKAAKQRSCGQGATGECFETCKKLQDAQEIEQGGALDGPVSSRNPPAEYSVLGLIFYNR
jgi:hypothetical protein